MEARNCGSLHDGIMGFPTQAWLRWKSSRANGTPSGRLHSAQLVAEWRGLRTEGEASSGRVDRAWASVRCWELEIAMLGDYGLTLPPETEPLDASRREDHLRWRTEALEEALAKARRLRWMRQLLTLGLRWS